MKYWKRVNPEGVIITVESYSFDEKITGAIEITQVEFDAYIASLPKPIPEVVRDLATEIDALKVDVAALKVKVGR